MNKGSKYSLLLAILLHISFFNCQILLPISDKEDSSMGFSSDEESISIHHHLSRQSDHRRLNSRRLSFLPINTDCFITGQVQEGFFYGKNIRTLNNDVPDVQTRFRHRMHVGFYFKHYDPLIEDKKPIVEAALKLHNMQWWQDENSNLLIKFYRVTSKIPQFSFSDAWVHVKSSAFNRTWSEHLHSLKVGYFPYQLGRGVSLGFADEGGIKYLGFEVSYDPIESAYYSPGVLLQGWIHPKVRYEFYASVLQSEYEPFFLQREVKQPQLFSRLHKEDPCNPYGTFMNRWVASEKIILFSEKDMPFQWRAEQYILYCNFEHHVDDIQLPLINRAIHGGTFGCMLDVSWNRWKLNVEVATQYGALKFFEYDNNDQVLQVDSTGKMKVFNDNAGIRTLRNEDFAMPASDPLLQALDTNQRFDTKKLEFTGEQGEPFFVLSENNFTTVSDLGNRIVALDNENSDSALQIKEDLFSDTVTPIRNVPHPQLRPEKNFNMQGHMLMIDLSYQCKNIPCTLNIAGGYLSGDQPPLKNDSTVFADDSQCSYRGFLPIRDHRYRGMGVKSFSYFTMRVIERPAGNNVHFNDISNLAFCGVGVTVLPKKKLNGLVGNSNLVFFFQPKDQYILNENGAATDALASSFANIELNGSLQYRFLPQCELLIRGAILVPQRLYRDMKNQKAGFMTTTGVRENVKRVGDVAYAMHVRITYDF
ncbi:hypothetical protein JKY79_00030 [Candidatus Babeliales bacterium]|nr:hypothetical protein [Candidatus Babeliales bacterium]